MHEMQFIYAFTCDLLTHQQKEERYMKELLAILGLILSATQISAEPVDKYSPACGRYFRAMVDKEMSEFSHLRSTNIKNSSELAVLSPIEKHAYLFFSKHKLKNYFVGRSALPIKIGLARYSDLNAGRTVGYRVDMTPAGGQRIGRPRWSTSKRRGSAAVCSRRGWQPCEPHIPFCDWPARYRI